LLGKIDIRRYFEDFFVQDKAIKNKGVFTLVEASSLKVEILKLSMNFHKNHKRFMIPIDT